MLRHPCRINSKAAFFILKAAAAHIADDGKIITIVTALLGAFTGFYTSYAGSKAPVEHFTRGVCKELMERRVSVNNVAPGPMDTRKLTYPRSIFLQLTPVKHSFIPKKPPRLSSSTRPMAWATG